MINPLRGVYLNDNYYNYNSDSFREARALKNSVAETQNDRTVSSAQGLAKASFALSIHLENQTTEINGGTEIGTTFWSGISRKADLEAYMNRTGVCLPLTFVTPYGATYNVIPTGTIDYNIYRADNPGSSGMEFTANISLEDT